MCSHFYSNLSINIDVKGLVNAIYQLKQEPAEMNLTDKIVEILFSIKKIKIGLCLLAHRSRSPHKILIMHASLPKAFQKSPIPIRSHHKLPRQLPILRFPLINPIILLVTNSSGPKL